MDKYFEDFSKYICAYSNFEDSEYVIIGIPYDGTTSFKPGTRFAPDEVRKASWGLETYSPILKKDLIDLNVCDIGNIIMDGSQKEIFNRIYSATKDILKSGKKLITIGGEHSITYPIFKGIVDYYNEDIILIQFDAHCDLRNEYLGNKYSHASVIRRCHQHTEDIYQFGIRSGDREEWEYGWKNTNISMDLPNKDVVKEIRDKDKKIYITVDIDVLDPAYAPGTGTPEPCGFGSKELINALYLFGDLKDRIVGFDVVEISPPYDIGGITSIMGAKIIREFILL